MVSYTSGEYHRRGRNQPTRPLFSFVLHLPRCKIPSPHYPLPPREGSNLKILPRGYLGRKIRVLIRVHSHLRQTNTANVARVAITVNPMMYKNAAGSCPNGNVTFIP